MVEHNVTYKLPSQVATGLNTNRSELVRSLGERLTEPLGLEAEKELLRLVADMILDREEQRVKIQEIEKATKTSLGNIRGAASSLERAIFGHGEEEGMPE